jgi:hypothetical protein
MGLIPFVSLFAHTLTDWWHSFFFMPGKHSNMAYLRHGVRGTVGAGTMWSIPVPCSQFTDISSPVLTG